MDSQELEEVLTEEVALSLEEFYDAVDEDCEPAVQNNITPPKSGIKLGGYIRWCQGIEYPTCPDCHIRMDTTFLQMEADSILFDDSWGDSGTAHVTLCPACKKPALGWACC